MPNEDVKLSEGQKAKFKKWLNDKGKNFPCPFCQENSWTIPDHLIEGLRFSGKGLQIGGSSYPQVVLVCNNCAYVRYFMAVRIGLLDGEQQEEDTEPKEKSDG